MTYQTHAYFASVLHPVICETWGIPLSRKRLVKGSIKPDMSALFLRHPHFWKHSHKYVEKKIRALARMAPDAGGKNGKLSERLGIVLHYVADYFTAVHNVSPNPIREHMEYENRLHALFRELVSEDSLRTTVRMIASDPEPFGERPKRALRDLRAAYAPKIEDPANDIRFVTIACLTVAAAIMDAVARNAAGDLDISGVSANTSR